MTTFNSDGYIAGAPLQQDQWRAVAHDQPSGLIVTPNSVPPGFLLVQNFIDASLCDAIVRECETQTGERHTIAGETQYMQTRESNERTSEFIDVRSLQTDIAALVRETYVQTVAAHFRKEIEWFELPEILRYKSGGEYKPHADADAWFADERKWKRIIDRDLSILIYLNGGYGGGEIDFPNFGFKLQPKRGLLIAFPSDSRYVHAARPVTSGVRYALVSWAAVRGGPRVNDAPRPHAIRI